MIKMKELKADAKNNNVDVLINEFFEELGEQDQIIEIHYSTAVVPIKRDGAVQYTVVSSALIMYDAADEDE